MVFSRGAGPVATVLCLALLLAAACQRAAAPPPATAPVQADDFHKSDPRTIGATGRPQLLEFYGPT